MPQIKYRSSNGRVPSVTTINKIGLEPGGLIHKAWQLGSEGKDYREEWGQAAATGTIGHLLMQAAIKGTELTAEDFPTDGSLDLGMKAFEAFKNFRDALRVKWTDSELSLVSEQYQFGGTID